MYFRTPPSDPLRICVACDRAAPDADGAAVSHSAGVLAVASVLALEWAAPFAAVSLCDRLAGVDAGVGDCDAVAAPSATAAGALLRIETHHARRLIASARSAVGLAGDSAARCRLVEAADGSWAVETVPAGAAATA
ncbi:MAG TPA: hypothetical protein DEP66_00870, partial [Acidimicrobiaceae bacterium]|nr:hypothetical protein [Acidimicrobiaceae bacterium]